MLPSPCRRRAALALFFLLNALSLPTSAQQPQTESKLLQQSFFFDWNDPTSNFPVPITEQCETIKIRWSRSTAVGPNPVPPYHLQVYTSLFLVPIIIPVGMGLSYDWAVPFPPGTMYQICMFDSNGNTGGCQDTYTVIGSSSDTPVNCANATIPPQLEVEGIVSNGPISRYGWVEQCTDIQLVPKNGTPPYFVTIAPALHPPYNMSGPGPFNWTVELSWASQFFIGVSDSAGNMWSHGVMHSGGPGESSCLSGKSSKDTVPAGAAAGAGVGGFIVGALGGLAAMFFFNRKKIKRLEREALLDLSGGDYGSGRPSIFNKWTQYIPVPSQSIGLLDSTGSSNNSGGMRPHTHLSNSQYRVEPFVLPSEDGRLPASPPSGVGRSVSSDPNSRQENKVYVVHHDSNAPPVTIYHEDGTEIVELPPRYPDGNRSPPPTQRTPNTPDARSDVTGFTGSGSGTSRSSEPEVPSFLQQPRRPDRPSKPGSRRPSPQ